MKVEWFAPLDEIPKATSQQKGVCVVAGRPKFYTKHRVKEVQEFYGFMIKTHRPPRLLEGAVRYKIVFYYPAKRGHKHGEPKVTRPDVDNLAKGLIDATIGTVIMDDSQIADLRIIKAYDRQCGIGFQAVEIGQGGVERE